MRGVAAPDGQNGLLRSLPSVAGMRSAGVLGIHEPIGFFWTGHSRSRVPTI